jgi:hypothetical protein
MAFLGQTFSEENLPQGNSGSFDPIPAGWYNANITAAELKPTKDGSGQYIKVRYDITGPTHEGRVVFGNLNIKNASAKAEEIGRQQLGEIMRAIGLSKVTDTDQLIGGSLSIKLNIREAIGQYPAQNEVKGFKAITGSAPSFAAPSSSTADSAPSASEPAKAAPPWARK